MQLNLETIKACILSVPKARIPLHTLLFIVMRLHAHQSLPTRASCALAILGNTVGGLWRIKHDKLEDLSVQPVTKQNH